MSQSYDTLKNMYETNFALVQFHKYSMSDLENMMPWERQLFIDLLEEHAKAESAMQRDRKAFLERQGRIG